MTKFGGYFVVTAVAKTTYLFCFLGQVRLRLGRLDLLSFVLK